jgi:mono/diheme cytochrome c family protein
MRPITLRALLLAAVVLSSGCARTPGYSGAEVFAANCASCHGRYGEGDGPIAADLARSMPDLRTLAARNGGKFPRDRVAAVIDGRAIVAAHGDRFMPVWGDAFLALESETQAAGALQRAEAKIDALVDFIASMQQSIDPPVP